MPEKLTRAECLRRAESALRDADFAIARSASRAEDVERGRVSAMRADGWLRMADALAASEAGGKRCICIRATGEGNEKGCGSG